MDPTAVDLAGEVAESCHVSAHGLLLGEVDVRLPDGAEATAMEHKVIDMHVAVHGPVTGRKLCLVLPSSSARVMQMAPHMHATCKLAHLPIGRKRPQPPVIFCGNQRAHARVLSYSYVYSY